MKKPSLRHRLGDKHMKLDYTCAQMSRAHVYIRYHGTGAGVAAAAVAAAASAAAAGGGISPARHTNPDVCSISSTEGR